MATAKGKKAAAAKKAAKKPAARKSPAAKAGAAAVSRKPASKKMSLKTKSGSVKPPVKAKATSGKKSPAKKTQAAKGGTSAKGKSSAVSGSKASPGKNISTETKTAGLKSSKTTASRPATKVSDTIRTRQKPVDSSKSGKSVSKAKNVPVKPVPVKSKEVSRVTSKPAAKTSKRPAPVKETGSKPAGEPLDPLIVKAEKAIREMEETMDLSKMRPRLQAGSPAIQRHLSSRNHQPPPKLPEPVNTNKVKFQLEFEFRSSPKILFTSLSDSSGLAGWFADEVQTQDDIFTFVWEGGESKARLVALRDLQLVRFQWLDDTDGTYFQFEIKEDDITSDIALVITDFANPGEKDTNIRLWETQVQNLRMLLGSL